VRCASRHTAGFRPAFLPAVPPLALHRYTAPVPSPRARTILKIAFVVAALVAFLVAVRLLPIAQWLEAFTSSVRDTGAAGYVLYVLAYVVCCVLLIPALALSLAAGAIYGFVVGSIIVLIGATLGATAAFLLARTFLRHRVEAMASRAPRFREIDRAIAREGTKVMWLVRLSGFPPFTWVNYAFGLTGVGLVPYLVTTFFGIIPGVLAFTWAGAAGAAALTGTGNRILLIVTATGAILVSVLIARIATRALRRAAAEAN
jgi:uncharacterized membrane protein YdjX (TVP38/TMEM64 family)